MPIYANLVVGRDGATTINGRSAPLSNGSDRERFHHIRSQADVILIGGNTSRAEPYERTPIPLVVLTHQEDLPGSAARNPKAVVAHETIASLLHNLSNRYRSILIEGGATLLMEALRNKLVDTLYLTSTDRGGSGPYFTLPQESDLVLASEEPSPDSKDLFLTYARLPV